MTILLAMSEYPDSYMKKSQLITEKFIEKYGGGCTTCFFKDRSGGIYLIYFGIFIGNRI